MKKQDKPSTPSIYDTDFMPHPNPGPQSKESAGTNQINKVKSVDIDHTAHPQGDEIADTDQQTEQAAVGRRKMVAYNEHGINPQRDGEATCADQPDNPPEKVEEISTPEQVHDPQPDEEPADTHQPLASRKEESANTDQPGDPQLEEMASNDYARALEERQKIKDFIANQQKGDKILLTRIVQMIKMDGLALLGYPDKKAFFTEIAKELEGETSKLLTKKYNLSYYYKLWDAVEVAIWQDIPPEDVGCDVEEVAVDALYPLHSKKLTPENRQEAWEHALTLARAVDRKYPTAPQVKESIKLVLTPDQGAEGDQDPSEAVEADEAPDEQGEVIKADEVSDDPQPVESVVVPASAPTVDALYVERLLNEHNPNAHDLAAIDAFLKCDQDIQYFMACVQKGRVLETITDGGINELLKPFRPTIKKRLPGEVDEHNPYLIWGSEKSTNPFLIRPKGHH